MTSRFLNTAVAFLAMTTEPVLAGDHELGRPPHMRAVPFAAGAPRQYAAPPSIAARSALPGCGFAGIELWGPNGFQYSRRDLGAAPQLVDGRLCRKGMSPCASSLS
jgi:hypothetical protein